MAGTESGIEHQAARLSQVRRDRVPEFRDRAAAVIFAFRHGLAD